MWALSQRKMTNHYSYAVSSKIYNEVTYNPINKSQFLGVLGRYGSLKRERCCCRYCRGSLTSRPVLFLSPIPAAVARVNPLTSKFANECRRCRSPSFFDTPCAFSWAESKRWGEVWCCFANGPPVRRSTSESRLTAAERKVTRSVKFSVRLVLHVLSMIALAPKKTGRS